MEFRVIKKDGSKEPFNTNKIYQVVLAAGLNPDQAKTVSDNVTNWVNSNKTAEINSSTIRTKVIEQLQKVDRYVAGLFTWYEKTKEN